MVREAKETLFPNTPPVSDPWGTSPTCQSFRSVWKLMKPLHLSCSSFPAVNTNILSQPYTPLKPLLLFTSHKEIQIWKRREPLSNSLTSPHQRSLRAVFTQTWTLKLKQAQKCPLWHTNTKPTRLCKLQTAGLLSCKVKIAIAKPQRSAGWGVSPRHIQADRALQQSNCSGWNCCFQAQTRPLTLCRMFRLLQNNPSYLKVTDETAELYLKFT